MSPSRLLFAVSMTATLVAAETFVAPYYTDPLTSAIDGNHWYVNGPVAATAAGLTVTSANGGSIISKDTVPDGTNNYAITANVNLVTGTSPIIVIYLRASNNALYGPALAGQYYAVTLSGFNNNGTSCSAYLQFVRYPVNGGVVALCGQSLPVIRVS